LFRQFFPPLDSTTEILGKRRQSRWFSSASRTNAAAKGAAGECILAKNRCKRTARASGFADGIGRFTANGRVMSILSGRTASGVITNPSTTASGFGYFEHFSQSHP
jgi:hypothetical protein